MMPSHRSILRLAPLMRPAYPGTVCQIESRLIQMKPFARWSEAELQARFHSLTAQVEAANKARMDVIMFELLDESTALAATLGRGFDLCRRGVYPMNTPP